MDMGGVSQLPGKDPVDEEVWSMFLEESPVQRKGYKVKLNRFFHGLQVARDDMRHWTARLLLYEYTAIENGMLAGRAAPKLKAAKDKTAEGGRPATDSSRLDVVERGVRRAGANALETAVTLFGDPSNQVLVRLILTATHPTEVWHRQQAHDLRSAPETIEWLRRQFSGEWVAHVHKTLRSLSTLADLSYCKFELPNALSPLAEKPSLGEVIRQDEFAEVFGGSVWRWRRIA